MPTWTDVREPCGPQVATLGAVTPIGSQHHGSSEMPHLHLPIDHTDDDLFLAANVAEGVGRADLYVAWSHENGPGAVPEVEAVLREERPSNPFVELLAAIRASFAALARAVFSRPGRAPTIPAAPAEPPRSAAGDPT